ncbi:trypsin-like peptidase domain-containing protein [Leptolyngbya sp. FACHB-261]|nr:trypsin-like peptidase domain-containing protein [Leptolyngbya sp. FACHB-261]
MSLLLVLALVFTGPLPAAFAQGNNQGRASLNTSVSSTGFDEDEQVNVSVYEQRSPGVVNITSTIVGYDYFRRPFPEGQGTGSGSVLDKQGNILTNYHVVRNANRLEVTLSDQSRYEAQLVGADPLNDLAVIKIDAPAKLLQPIPLANTDGLRVGQKVLAIGNPFGLSLTLTVGVVSALNREIKSEVAGRAIRNMVQTDAAINPGNSGGPLLNRNGELVGVNTMIFSASGASAGIGFAVPVTAVRRVVPDLLAYGQVQRGWLGVAVQPLTPPLSEVLKLPVDRGVLVARVERGSPAAKAGLHGGSRDVALGNLQLTLGGDIITGINGKPIASGEELAQEIEDRKPGDRIQLDVVRGTQASSTATKLQRIAVTLELHPAQ